MEISASLELLIFENPSIDGNHHDTPGDHLPAGSQRLLDGIFDPAAAGYLHAYNHHALDIVFASISP